MKLFIDTEFNGFGGQLLSIALIAEDMSATLYEEILAEGEIHPWVEEHVMPYMGASEKRIPIESLPERLSRFLNQWDDVEIIADWPDDLRYFMESLITAPGWMVDVPNNISFRLIREMDGQSEIPHNAYWDALGNLLWWREQYENY